MKIKESLFTITEGTDYLQVTIPRGFPNLPTVRKKYYANAFYFFLPIALILFYFSVIRPLQYQMNPYFEYAIPVVLYLMLPVLVRIIPLSPVVWFFSKQEIRIGKKIYNPEEVKSVTLKTLKGRKRTSFATHAGQMGVELNPEWKFHEIQFRFKGRKRPYVRLFEDIENHGLHGLVDKIRTYLHESSTIE